MVSAELCSHDHCRRNVVAVCDRIVLPAQLLPQGNSSNVQMDLTFQVSSSLGFCFCVCNCLFSLRCYTGSCFPWSVFSCFDEQVQVGQSERGRRRPALWGRNKASTSCWSVIRWQFSKQLWRVVPWDNAFKSIFFTYFNGAVICAACWVLIYTYTPAVVEAFAWLAFSRKGAGVITHDICARTGCVSEKIFLAA